jgi:hypothetical protein
MMTNAYYSPIKNTVTIGGKQPNDSIILCSKERSMARIHWSMLKQFRLSDGSYMMSEDLLMVIARVFSKEFEDLWNKTFMNDQIDQIRRSSFAARTDEHEINGLIISIDV